jgi:hypothetical protein
MSLAFNVYVLCYGSYPALARRCLDSIGRRLLVKAEPQLVRRVIIGLNEVSDDTARLVADFSRVVSPLVPVFTFNSPVNRLKYPLMREMFKMGPIDDVDYLMWFDDDSFLKDDFRFEEGLRPFLEHEHPDMLGARYYMRLVGNQAAWIEAQPWYNQRRVQRGRLVTFITGGWWCLRPSVVTRWGWPPDGITHRGGDVMLGELFRQQDLVLRHFNQGVAINADAQGRESKAERRGRSVTDPAVGIYWRP